MHRNESDKDMVRSSERSEAGMTTNEEGQKKAINIRRITDDVR